MWRRAFAKAAPVVGLGRKAALLSRCSNGICGNRGRVTAQRQLRRMLPFRHPQRRDKATSVPKSNAPRSDLYLRRPTRSVLGRQSEINQAAIMPTKMNSFTIAIAVVLALAASPAIGQYDDEAADKAALPHDEKPRTATGEEEEQRAREGTRIVNQIGRFRTTGDRLTFQPAGSEKQYLGLENLALERVGKVLLDRHGEAEKLQWEVSGTFTEYRGTNYLFVTHAVLKTKPQRGTVLSRSTP